MDCSVIRHEGLEYEILGRLDNWVLAARTKTGQQVAIKVLNKLRVYFPYTARKDILNEKALMESATRSGKPFLINLLASWDDDENIYFMMPLYCETLIHFIVREGPYEMDHLYIAELIAALSNLHDIGIIHRDIKPENVLIAPSGHLVLSDFGLSEYWSPAGNDESCLIGTPGYMPPEMLTGAIGSFGYASDVWSMGLVIFELVLRKTESHFCGDDAEIESRVLSEDVPLEAIEDVLLRDLLDKMLIRDPTQRWSTQALKEHPYFRDIDWDQLEKGEYKPCQRPGPPSYDPKFKRTRISSWHREFFVSKTKGAIYRRVDKKVVVRNRALNYQLDEDIQGRGPKLFSFRAPSARYNDVLYVP